MSAEIFTLPVRKPPVRLVFSAGGPRKTESDVFVERQARGSKLAPDRRTVRHCARLQGCDQRPDFGRTRRHHDGRHAGIGPASRPPPSQSLRS